MYIRLNNRIMTLCGIFKVQIHSAWYRWIHSSFGNRKNNLRKMVVDRHQEIERKYIRRWKCQMPIITCKQQIIDSILETTNSHSEAKAKSAYFMILEWYELLQVIFYSVTCTVKDLLIKYGEKLFISVCFRDKKQTTTTNKVTNTKTK